MNIEVILIGIGVGAVEFFLKPIQKMVTPIIKKSIENRLRKNQKGVYEGKVAISSILRILEDLPEVIKAVQIQTKNGGGIPKAGTPIYGTIVSPSKYSETFNNQLLDSQYCSLISQLITDKKVVVKTEDLPECMLRDLFLSQGVKSTLCYDMAITKSDYNFIAIDFNVPIEQLSDKTRDEIRTQINELHTLLNI